jgi:hypothetical protein
MSRRYASALGVALMTPWRTWGHVQGLRTRWLASYAAAHLVVAASLSTLLSSWIYLVGKGFFLGVRGMDMGTDDLPPDTAGQVAAGLSLSLLIWGALLALLLGICLAVARRFYGPDQDGYRTARKCLYLVTPWLVVWAGAVLVANARLEGELRHPAAAIRAYAQLRERGFRGSSAVDPGEPARTSFGARARLVWLAAGLPVVWGLGLRARAGGRINRGAFGLLMVGACWLVAWAAARLLPWIAIGAYVG